MSWLDVVNESGTLEDVIDLHRMGYEFPCADGKVTKIVTPLEAIKWPNEECLQNQ